MNQSSQEEFQIFRNKIRSKQYLTIYAMRFATSNQSNSNMSNYKCLTNKNKIKSHNNKLRLLITVLRLKYDNEQIDTPDKYLEYKCFIITNSIYRKYITSNKDDTLDNVLKVEEEAISKICDWLSDGSTGITSQSKRCSTKIISRSEHYSTEDKSEYCSSALMEYIMPRIRSVKAAIADFIQKEGTFTKLSRELYLYFHQIITCKTLKDVIDTLVHVRNNGEDWTCDIIKSCFGSSKIISILSRLNSVITKVVVGKYVISAINICEKIAAIESQKFRWKQEGLAQKGFEQEDILSNMTNAVERLYPSLFPEFLGFSQYVLEDAKVAKYKIVEKDTYEYMRLERRSEIFVINPTIHVLSLNIIWEMRVDSDTNSCIGLLKISDIQILTHDMYDVDHVLSILNRPSIDKEFPW